VEIYLHSPNTPSWRGAQVIRKHRDNLTFYFTFYTTTKIAVSNQELLINNSSSRVLEKLRVIQLLKKFPAFYGTRRFISVFTRTRHCALP
jgi:hypothetical protein